VAEIPWARPSELASVSRGNLTTCLKQTRPEVLEASGEKSHAGVGSESMSPYPHGTRGSGLMRQVEGARFQQDGFHCVKNSRFEEENERHRVR